MPAGVAQLNAVSLVEAIQDGFDWLIGAISGVIDVIISHPLFYVPITLVTVISFVGAMVLLIFNISDRGYSQGTVSRFNGWFGKSRIETSPVGSLLLFKAKKSYHYKKIADERASYAYSKIVKNSTNSVKVSEIPKSVKVAKRPFESNLVLNPSERDLRQAKLYHADYTAHTREYYRNFDRINELNRAKFRSRNPARARLIDVTVDDDE